MVKATPHPAPKLVLASQSLPRKLLLERLKIPFLTIPSAISETQEPNETPMELVERLSREKAFTVAVQINAQHNSAHNQPYIIIGSDQVAVFDNQVYGKPENFDNAFEQLNKFNNNTIQFITGLCLVKLFTDGTTQVQYNHEISTVKLKNLTSQQIENYLHLEQPYQCAASFKIEGLGISLVKKIETKDFNAIIGLPLIQLIEQLQILGLDVLG